VCLGCSSKNACHGPRLGRPFAPMPLRPASLLGGNRNVFGLGDSATEATSSWTSMTFPTQCRASKFLFPACEVASTDTAVEPRHSQQLATCFGVGEAAAGLRSASDFLFSIDSGRAWDQFQELFKTPAVLAKYDKDFEYWVAEATDANNDLNRAKELLQQALQNQAPQPEDEQVVVDQD
ncbi:grpE, partial [Symbiodinium pilosum]